MTRLFRSKSRRFQAVPARKEQVVGDGVVTLTAKKRGECMPTSDQLAREAAATRERLSRTIDELRLRASPAKLMEDVGGFLRNSADGTAPEARGPSRYMLPLAIIGAGLTWLALEARRSERSATAAVRREQAEAEILPTAEMDVIVTPVSPTVAPDQGATLRPVETVSITPDGVRPEKVDPDQRPLPL
jgi:hypothetical protein